MHIIGSSVAYLEDSKYYILLKHAKGVECYLQTNLIKRRGSRMIQISLNFLKTQSCEWDTSNKILTICIEDNSKKINSLFIYFFIFFIFFLFNIIDSVYFPISTLALVTTIQFSIYFTISYQLLLWHQINYWNWMVICFACNKRSTNYYMIDIHMHWVQCIYNLYAYGANLLVLLIEQLSLGCCTYIQVVEQE